LLEKKILEELKIYIERHQHIDDFVVFKSSEEINYSLSESIQSIELEDFINHHRKPTLKHVLFQFIDEKGAKDSDIYKKAGVDRKHFSKIRSNPNYRPGKHTIIALALALELNKDETDELLGSAGFSLSDSDTSDLVIQFCLERKIYSIDDVNQALDYFSLKPLTNF